MGETVTVQNKYTRFTVLQLRNSLLGKRTMLWRATVCSAHVPYPYLNVIPQPQGGCSHHEGCMLGLLWHSKGGC